MTFQKIRLFDTADYAVVDYESASDVIIENARQRNSYGVFAMPVHGLVTAVKDPAMYDAAQKADMIVPDGQPVRWAMNHFYHVGLKDRVYGPTLTLYVLKKADRQELKVFLYGGSTEEALEKFAAFIQKNYPNVEVCGQYREKNPDGDSLSTEEINASGAHIILVGRGCPRQEIWVANRLGKVKGVMMAVGAAFGFHAGTVKQAPRWMQDYGLEWLFRLLTEPRRLWRRYFYTNSYFVLLFLKYKLFSKNRKRSLHT